MRESDLTRGLAEAADALGPADQIVGRDAVERRVQKHQRQRLAAVLSVVVVLVGGAAIGLSRTGSEEQGLVTTPDLVAEIPRIVPGYVPPGWQPDYLTDFGELAMETSPTSMPTVEVRLSATWVDSDSPEPEVGARAAMVTAYEWGSDGAVAETAAPGTSVSDLDVWMFGDHGQVSWRTGDWSWILSSRGIDEEALRAMVGQLEPTADGQVLAPEGFREVTRRGPSEVRPFMGTEWMASPGPPSGYSYGFRQIDATVTDSGHTMQPSVMVMGGGGTDPWITYALGSDPLASTTVQGHPAQLWRLKGQSCSTSSSDGSGSSGSESCTSDPLGYSLAIDWTDDVRVTVYGGTEDDVRRIADGLTEVDEATWQRFVSSLDSMMPVEVSTTTMQGGEFSGEGIAGRPPDG